MCFCFLIQLQWMEIFQRLIFESIFGLIHLLLSRSLQLNREMVGLLLFILQQHLLVGLSHAWGLPIHSKQQSLPPENLQSTQTRQMGEGGTQMTVSKGRFVLACAPLEMGRILISAKWRTKHRSRDCFQSFLETVSCKRKKKKKQNNWKPNFRPQFWKCWS